MEGTVKGGTKRSALFWLALLTVMAGVVGLTRLAQPTPTQASGSIEVWPQEDRENATIDAPKSAWLELVPYAARDEERCSAHHSRE